MREIQLEYQDIFSPDENKQANIAKILKIKYEKRCQLSQERQDNPAPADPGDSRDHITGSDQPTL